MRVVKHIVQWSGRMAIFLIFAAASPAAFDPVISEFMASNRSTLNDEDGTSSDWIEILNVGDSSGNLNGWYLTDDAVDLTRWAFPDTPLEPGGYLVVFASGKNRQISGSELHTSFELNAAGEYLALVQPDGITIAMEFTPAFPAQLQDVSYGLVNAEEAWIDRNSPLRYLVPVNGTLGTFWIQNGFDDSGWQGTLADIPTTLVITEVGTGNPDRIEIQNVANQTIDTTGWKVAFCDELSGINGVEEFLWSLPSSFSTGQVLHTDDNANGLGNIYWQTSGSGWVMILNATGKVVDFTAWGFGASEVQTMNINTTVNGFDIRVTGADLPWIGAGRPSGNTATPILIRSGNEDHDDFTDFTFSNVGTFGSSNPGLTTPFLSGVPVAATPGLGYENNPNDAINYVDEIVTPIPAGTVSCYARFTFPVSSTSNLSQLILRMQYDDGFVAHLNGVEVFRANAPGTPQWDSTATTFHNDGQSETYLAFDITAHQGALQTGTNVLALQGLNFGSESSDMLLSPELIGVYPIDPLNSMTGFLPLPTPGTANAGSTINAGPFITEITENPAAPVDHDDLLITALVTEKTAPIQSINLIYRINYGTPVVLAMNDDGTSGDALGGDNIYSAIIPASASLPGDMVRWAVTASDTSNNASRNPVLVSPLGQNNSAEYLGTMVPDPSVSGIIPAYYWWTEDEAASRTTTGTRGSVFYEGRFYDNVFVRKRGGYTNVRSQKFDFNKSAAFYANAEVFDVAEINLNANGSDSSYLRQQMAFDFHRETVNPASIASFVQMRLNGAYDRIGVMIEQVDEHFLLRNRNDPAGDLYKFVQRSNLDPAFTDLIGVEKKTADKSDYSTLQVLIDQLKLTPAERKLHLYDHLDIPEFMNYFACRVVLLHADDVRKNFYMYYDTHGDGLWRIYPWDLDWIFGITGGHNNQDPNRVQHPFWGIEEFPTADGADQWNRLYDAVFENVELRQMLLRRVRSLMDSHLKAPGTAGTGSWFEPWVDTFWATISSFSGPSASGMTALKNYIEVRRNDLFNTYSTSIPGFPGEVIPTAQTGASHIFFGAVEFNPVSGNQEEEYVELINTNAFAVDLSGWQVDGGIKFTFRSGTVIPSRTNLYLVRNVAAFRARGQAPRGGQGHFSVGGYLGGLNNFGEALNLATDDGTPVDSITYVGAPTSPQRHLRITELNFRPEEPDSNFGEALVSNEEYEFIELMNLSSEPLDISGVQFTAGITYTFPSNSVLAGEARILLIRNQGAFETRYGSGRPIVGQYTGALNNGGERIELRDAAGNKIHEFIYQDTFTRFSDLVGTSMVVNDTAGDYEDRENWIDSVYIGGSPGVAEPAPIRDVIVNEVLSHTDPPLSDSIELYNLSDTPIDIGGWYLSDSATQLRKYLIPPGTIIPPGEYLVFDESHFNPTPLTPGPNDFALNGAHGDEAWLVVTSPFGRLQRIADQVSFGAAIGGESFGRWLNADGRPYPMTARTLDSENSGPRVGPLVLSELMYNYPGDTIGLYEFVEVYNPGPGSTFLDQWRLGAGLDFGFPPGESIGADKVIVVVGFDPVADPGYAAAFRSVYGIDAGVDLLGPFTGRLSNAGETIRLHRPDSPPAEEPGFYPMLLEDEVRYLDEAPWPAAADGGGSSLTRLHATYWGNDPFSWIAASPTPGQFTPTVLSGFALWRITEFPTGTPAEDRDPFADPNLDGVVNLAAYAFVIEPFDQAIAGEPVLRGERTADGKLEIRHRRRIAATDIQYLVSLSSRLDVWDNSETFVTPAGPPVPLGDGLTEEVILYVDISSAFPQGIGFVRIDVLMP